MHLASTLFCQISKIHIRVSLTKDYVGSEPIITSFLKA